MGLDTVEFILDVEREFNIEFNEEEFPAIQTFGKLSAFIVDKITGKQNGIDLSKYEMQSVQILKEYLPEVLPNDKIRKVLPQRKDRVRLWRKLSEEFESKNKLNFSFFYNLKAYNIGLASTAMLFAIGIFPLVEICDRVGSWFYAAVIYPIAWIMCSVLAGTYMSGRYSDIPPHYQTFSDIARKLTYLYYSENEENYLLLPENCPLQFVESIEIRLKDMLSTYGVDTKTITRDTELWGLLN